MTLAVNIAQGGSNNVTFRNRIINGAMVIDQRNAGASVSVQTTTSYTLDRWAPLTAANSKYTIQQNAGSVTPPAGFTNYLGVTVAAAANVTVGATDQYVIRQLIEGFNVADLAWGTANAKTVTLSFWVYSSLGSGTYGGALINSAGDRSYPFTYTISSANTWEQKSITIAGSTTGTWVTNNGNGLNVSFSIGVGTTYSGTAGSWASTYYASATGAVKLIETNNATWYITGVQLEAGTTASPFEYRQYGTELALCQRYYEKTYDIGTAPATATDTGRMNYSASSEGNGNFITDINFKVTKRAAPTLTAYVGGGTSGIWTYEKSGASGTNAVTFDLIGQSHVRAYVSIGSNWTACYVYGHWTASAEL